MISAESWWLNISCGIVSMWLVYLTLLYTIRFVKRMWPNSPKIRFVRRLGPSRNAIRTARKQALRAAKKYR